MDEQVQDFEENDYADLCDDCNEIIKYTVTLCPSCYKKRLRLKLEQTIKQLGPEDEHLIPGLKKAVEILCN